MMTAEQRINYYLGDLANHQSVDQVYLDYLHKPYITDNNKYYAHNIPELKWNEAAIRKNYILPLQNVINKAGIKDKNVVMCVGDVFQPNNQHGNVYAFSKTRRVDTDSSRFTLVKCFNIYRHWQEIRHMDLQPFKNKKPNAIWRGTTTGKADIDDDGNAKNTRSGNRFDLIDNNFNRRSDIDIGFSFIHRDRFKKKYTKMVKGKIPPGSISGNKYIISAEGNDKDSGINWKLRMNSVVLMPKPTIASWLMEDTLVPDIHYVQLRDDYTDLTDKIDWCNDNQDKCEEIIHNAHVHMSQFLDQKQEMHIEQQVVLKALDKISYV